MAQVSGFFIAIIVSALAVYRQILISKEKPMPELDEKEKKKKDMLKIFAIEAEIESIKKKVLEPILLLMFMIGLSLALLPFSSLLDKSPILGLSLIMLILLSGGYCTKKGGNIIWKVL